MTRVAPLCALLIALVAVPSAHAAYPGANGMIAFDSRGGPAPSAEEDGYQAQSNVWAMNADGSGGSPITVSGANEFLNVSPNWSADGNKLVFTRCPGVLFGCGVSFRIFTINSDRSGETEITTGTDGSWSPDGTRIAFRDNYAYPDGTKTLALFVVNADGTGRRMLGSPTGCGVGPARWSPIDGHKILYYDGCELALNEAASDAGLFTINPDAPDPGATKTRISNMPCCGIWGTYDWSPDATKVVFTYQGPGGPEYTPDLFVLDVATGVSTNITNTDSPQPTFEMVEEQPSWSPDGTRIAFQKNGEVLTMPAPGFSGATVKLTENTWADANPAWQPCVAGVTLRCTPPDPPPPPPGPQPGDIDGDGVPDGEDPDSDGDGVIDALDPDENNDGITDEPEPPPSDPSTGTDVDEDGLSDEVEVSGLDTDADGIANLDLAAMGADPLHKDLFVELDAMSGHVLDRAALADVTRAFAFAPVSNPDAVGGIWLHVDHGPDSVMDPRTGATWAGRSRFDTVPHLDVLGTIDGDRYDWQQFDELKRISPARRAIFRYAISAHQYNPNNSSGIARGIPSPDFLVTLGGLCPVGDCSGTELMQAGTFMHELGHSLNLRHGGGDDTNNKPAYRSVMNYLYQFGLRSSSGLYVDYSRGLPFFDWPVLDYVGGMSAYGAALPRRTSAVGEPSVKKLLANARIESRDRKRPTVALRVVRRGNRVQLRAVGRDNRALDRLIVVVSGRQRVAKPRASAPRTARLSVRLRPGRNEVRAAALDAVGNRSRKLRRRVRVSG